MHACVMYWGMYMYVKFFDYVAGFCIHFKINVCTHVSYVHVHVVCI